MMVSKTGQSSYTTMVLGVNGFVGQHLARELHAHGHRVIGVGNTPDLATELHDIVTNYCGCDLADEKQVSTLPLEEVSGIINLAGLANAGASFSDPDTYMRINELVQTNICKVLEQQKRLDIRILAVSSGAVYDGAAPMPLTETSPVISEGSPYALSKLGMEEALRPYQERGLDIIIVRPFNHTGPGQGVGFLVPDLISQLRTAASSDRIIQVGNLKTERDYTDVRDIVRAYRLLLEAPKLSQKLYNVCSGKSRRGAEILETLEDLLQLSDITVNIDQARIRPSDPAVIYGSSRHLTEDTGWKPQISFEETLKDSL